MPNYTPLLLPPAAQLAALTALIADYPTAIPTSDLAALLNLAGDLHARLAAAIADLPPSDAMAARASGLFRALHRVAAALTDARTAASNRDRNDDEEPLETAARLLEMTAADLLADLREDPAP